MHPPPQRRSPAFYRRARAFALALISLAWNGALLGAAAGAFTGCDGPSGDGTLQISIHSDGSFDARRVSTVELRVDGDGPDPVTRELSVVDLENGVTALYAPTMNPGVLTVSAKAFDAAGVQLAVGRADSFSWISTVDPAVDVVLRSSLTPPIDASALPGDLAVIDASIVDLRVDQGLDPRADLAVGPPPDQVSDLPPMMSDENVSLDMTIPVDMATPPDLVVADMVPMQDLAFVDGQTCDYASCPLGCLQTRCLRPFPSNLTFAPKEALLVGDVVIKIDTTIDVATGVASAFGKPSMLPFSWGIENGAQPFGAPRLAVFYMHSLTVQKGLRLRFTDSSLGAPGYAVVILTSGDVVVDGTIEAGAYGASVLPDSGSTPGPGGYAGATSGLAGKGPINAFCGGTSGASGIGGDDGGGGGGGTASAGGIASRGPSATAGRGGVGAIATAIPLQGGCGGGSGSNSTNNNARAAGGGGGGALEISCGSTITIAATGVIDVAGNGGVGGQDVSAGGGGGGGGTVLLEAPVVNVNAGAIIAANGGGGGAGGDGNGGNAAPSGQPGQPAIGTAGKGGDAMSAGGDGAYLSSPSGGGAPIPGSINGGGGGGGLGIFMSIFGRSTIALGTSSAVTLVQKVAKTY